MQRIDKERIENITLDVLKDTYAIQKIAPPIDIIRIYKRHGLTLKVGSFADDRVAGTFTKETKTVLINSNDNYYRRVFTAAHELGHYVLHKDRKSDIFYRTDNFNPAEQEEIEEAEANFFASCILMPRFLIMQYWHQFKDPRNFAYFFRVSNTAAFWRLNNLGLIKK